MSIRGKLSEMESLSKSKRALLAKEARIRQSLEFTAFENLPKKKKALERLQEKLRAVDNRIRKLTAEF